METDVSQDRRPERTLIALSLACAFGIFAFAGAMGLAESRVAGVIFAVGIAACVAWLFWPVASSEQRFLRRPILPFDEEAAPRSLKVISGVATIAALVQLACVCVFIVNPTAVRYAIGPLRGPGLAVNHSCVSAYFVAAQSVPTVPNVYSDELYSYPSEKHALRKPKPIGSFNIDVYEYPPPFLLLPRAVAVAAPDFLHFRMIWFGLNGAVVLIGLLAIARMMGPVAGTRALLLCPLVLVSDFTISTFQIGNLQLMVFALAMLGMMFLSQGRYLTGGTLLAYATLSKMFPGMLLVYLLVRRRWRALAWTVGLSAVLIAISLLDTGLAPYRAFIEQLPRTLGGEAFPGFRNPVSVARNFSVPGMVFKLQLFGLPGTSFGATRVVGWIYTLIAVAGTVVLARRTVSREGRPLIWLGILILASLRSPFLPPYALFPALWLLTLLAAIVVPTVKRLWLVLLAWVMLNAFIPQLHPDPRLISMVILLQQAVIAIFVGFTFRNWSESCSSHVPAECQCELADNSA